MFGRILRNSGPQDLQPNAADFDPKWAISAFWNMASRHSRYTSRGLFTGFTGVSLSEASFINTSIGPAYDGNSNYALFAADGWNYSPSTVEGSFLALTRMLYASSSPPASQSLLIDFAGYTGGTWVARLACQNGGNIDFGWYNNGINTLVSVAKAGLWAAGDLALFGFSYSPLGTRAFINGKLVASSGSAPSTFLTSSHSMAVGIGTDPFNPSISFWGSPIYYAAVLDRALPDTEWGEIVARPFEWMYAPRSYLPALSPLVVVPSVLQTAVSM